MKYEEKNWGHLVTFSVMVKPDHSEVASPDHPFLFQQITNWKKDDMFKFGGILSNKNNNGAALHTQSKTKSTKKIARFCAFYKLIYACIVLQFRIETKSWIMWKTIFFLPFLLR